MASKKRLVKTTSRFEQERDLLRSIAAFARDWITTYHRYERLRDEDLQAFRAGESENETERRRILFAAQEQRSMARTRLETAVAEYWRRYQ